MAQTDDWCQDGARSLADWLCYRFDFGIGEAKTIVETAERLASLPLIAEAFAQGRLSWNRMVEIAKLADEENEEHFATHAHEYNMAELRKMARNKTTAKPKDVKEAFDVRHLRLRERGQQLMINGAVPIDLGGVVAKALSRICDGFGIDPETGVFARREQQLADALVELASMRVGTDNDPDRANVCIEVEASDLVDGGHGDFENRASVPVETIRRLMCDGRVQFKMMQDGQAIGIGRMSRTFPAWMNRLMRRRDQGCRFPGCWRTLWVHGHHIEFWSNLGKTDMDNSVLLCPIHHHLVHEAGWTIEGDPNGRLEFHRPDGRVFSSEVPLRPEVLAALKKKLKAEMPDFDLFGEPELKDSA